MAFIQGRGGEAFGSLALLAMAGFRVLPSMAALMATTNEIRTSWPAFERTTAELAAAQPVLHAADRPYERITFEESIEVRDASFTYPARPTGPARHRPCASPSAPRTPSWAAAVPARPPWWTWSSASTTPSAVGSTWTG
ncbi:hypothetical protein GS507_25395 [Rhodococcus hoagii]|nr:hypothetical protein [Prescottella equi]